MKIDDRQMAKEYGVFALPAILFFKMGSKEPVIYAGNKILFFFSHKKLSHATLNMNLVYSYIQSTWKCSIRINIIFFISIQIILIFLIKFLSVFLKAISLLLHIYFCWRNPESFKEIVIY